VQRWLLELLGVNVDHYHVRLSCPGLPVVSDLTDRKSVADGKHEVGILNGKVARAISHNASAANVKRIGVRHHINVIPACCNRDVELWNKLFKYLKSACKSYSVTCIKHGALCGKYLFCNLVDDLVADKGSKRLLVLARIISDKLIGLDGKSDDYFLAEITLFVKPGATRPDDVIVAAKSNLVKKTVTAKDVVIGRSTRSEDKYFINEDNNLVQIMTGYIDFGGIKAYVNNAPTSYKNLKPNGTKGTAKFFNLTSVGVTEETFTYGAATAIAEQYLTLGSATTGSKVGYDALDEAFAAAYGEIYYGGLYEADIYDVDGDGFAEYVNVKPYRMVTIDEQNKSYYFIERDNAEATTGSTKKDSILIKGEFTYGKPVLAYYPNNNYMEVKETLTPVKSYVARQKSVTGDMSVTSTAAAGTEYTLQSGEVISTLYANDKYGFSVGSLSASSAAIITVYAKDGILLYTNSTSYGNFDTNANYAYIIPYKLASDPTNTTGQDMMLYEAQGVVGGKVVSSFFVNAIIDGKK
jgi:hypothetical protein